MSSRDLDVDRRARARTAPVEAEPSPEPPGPPDAATRSEPLETRPPDTTFSDAPRPTARRDRRSTHRRYYVPVGTKFLIAVIAALAWFGCAFLLSFPWEHQLEPNVGPVAAWTIIALLAFLPGFLVAFLAASMLLDRQPRLTVRNPTTGVTILIAARNEEAGIADTIRYAVRTDYDGPVTVVLADNGSTDGTCAVAQQAADELGIELVVAYEATPGKSHALNRALETVTTPYVVTVDADTLLHPQALRRLVSRLESAPADTVAVAGSVLVRNSRDNLLTRMQEWDYFLGIAAVKRVQGLYQSTLVAQGAFSLYRTDQLRSVGGWPDAIGEDIVVTWRLMAGGQRVYFEPTAVAFTDVPNELRHFMRQRARWARGMFEGLREVPPWRQSRGLTRMIAAIDLLIPLLDLGYVGLFLPGLALWALGETALVGVWTLLVLPVTVVVYGGLRHHQRTKVFGPLGLSVRRNRVGYVAFLLLYQALCSVASIAGYLQELAGTRRRWK
ncbi:MAG: glycosyltransferase family 2 protein [Acidimicrobiia bacterium]